jgi:hypothetical protein
LSWWLVDLFGLSGVAMSYAVNYSFYWMAMAYLVKVEMRKMENHARM